MSTLTEIQKMLNLFLEGTTSEAFTGEAIGQVEEIGLQIYKNKVLNTDPTAATDARVVEVKVLLDPMSSRKVKAFTNLEVTVAIKIQ